MYFWRPNNFERTTFRTWNHQTQDYESPFSKNLVDNYLCRHCGKTAKVCHFEMCKAKTSFCYKCRQFGHFARMCQFHDKPASGKILKRKSATKRRRDTERMQKFKERKAMSIFPCAELNNIELVDFLPGPDLNKEMIEKLTCVKQKNERLHSEKVKLKMKSAHYERKYVKMCEENEKLMEEIQKLEENYEKDMNDFVQQIEENKEKIDNLQCYCSRMYDQRCEAIDLQFKLQREKEKMQEEFTNLRTI